ncbi:hypothetical protein BKE38_15930 [Pseudoroseomonas deserti]|uniref:Protein-glutamine gamma-glutamyltransferase-like C-terminal domain-containing protein n=1 Tax=Teichococcus deserti TaxID=1817963 RepID=A0A1V2H2K5_9PROT|nr:DUF4129 domain-containing protein [Pseudoroseomonas deserti]ONG51576.1 hypothetical protein BKE38_15930 [Pseudoroseomonas deserti]
MDETARAGIAAAHARLLADDRLQFAFPDPLPATPPPATRSGGGSWNLDWLAHLGPVAQVILWGLVALLVLGLAWVVYRQLRQAHRRREGAVEAAIPPAEAERQAARAGALLAEADALAAAGRFAEAVRLLLHQSLAEIGTQRPRLLRPAHTSRDIAALAPLPAPVREAFGAIAAVVERAVFGGRAMGDAQWQECRGFYARLTEPAAWAA